MIRKKFRAVLCVFLISVTLGLQVSAAGTDTYSHKDTQDGDSISAYSREMFTPVRRIKAEDIGLDYELDGITDICVDKQESIYILCGGQSRLVVLNSDYSLNREFKVLNNEGSEEDFTGAEGVFVSEDGKVYISDTVNGRVLVCNEDGKLTNTILLPKSSLIPADFIYQPVKVVIDARGYMYILSLGSYYGALTFSPEGEFIGFFGSNTVKAGALDTLSYIWDRLTGTDEKRALSQKSLPYSFVDFCIDSDGYMLTCSIDESSKQSGKGQIKKVTFNGSNILYKRTNRGDSVTSDNVNFLETKEYLYQGSNVGQRFCAIDVDEYGFIYALDITFGLVYVFDSECNAVNVFGGGFESGNTLGVYTKPSTLAVKGNSVIVADSTKLSLTIYEATEYGNLLRKAQNLYERGNYGEGKPVWQQVLSLDRSCQLAYRGLAMAAYNEGDYDQAMKLAKSGLSYQVYDLARQEAISKYLSDNFVWIFLLLLAIVVAVIVFAVKMRLKKKVLIKNKKIKLPLIAAFHPFDTFNEVKQYSQGSVTAAVIITALLYIAFTLKATLSGFLFKTTSSAGYNMLYTLLQTVGLLMLWCVADWLVCSLFSGKGSFKEIFIVTTYSLVPLVIVTFAEIVFTHLFSSSVMSVVYGIETAVWIYTFFLIIVGMMSVHEFDFFKFALTGIVVVFFMIIIIFVGFMFVMLLSEVSGFVADIYNEVILR